MKRRSASRRTQQDSETENPAVAKKIRSRPCASTSADSGTQGVSNTSKVEASSDSSSDEFTKAKEIDFDSEFFKIKQRNDFSALESNIFSGISRLSESDDSDIEDAIDVSKNSNIICNLPAVAQDVKNKVKNNGAKSKANKPGRRSRISNETTKRKSDRNKSGSNSKHESGEIKEMDVLQLLAIGEGSSNLSHSISHLKDTEILSSHDELSDWEDVKENDIKPVIPKEGVQITLEGPDIYSSRRKKGFDIEGHIKRRINRVKREVQIFIHKVHLLCWIAHGRFINSVLNDSELLSISLSLLPSDKCYPPKYAGLNYLESIVSWFRDLILLKPGPYSKNYDIPLAASLEEQFAQKAAKSIQYMVLMFICVLRAIGMKTRLIISLQPLPLKPPYEELCNLSKKTSKNSTVSNKVEASTSQSQNDKTKTDVSLTSSKKQQVDIKKKTNKGNKKEITNKNQTLSKNKLEKASTSQTVKTKTSTSPNKQQENAKKKTSKKGTQRNLKVENLDSKSKRDVPAEEIKTKVIKRNKKETLNNVENAESRSLRTRKNVSKYKEQDSSESEDTAKEDVKSKASKKMKTSAKGMIEKTKKEKLQEDKTGNKRNRATQDSSDSDFEPKVIVKSEETNSDSEDDFEQPKKRVVRKKSDAQEKKAAPNKKDGIDVWLEVFLEAEEKWISVDVSKGKIHCVSQIYARATHPVTYVLAFNNNLTVKDVTRRYCPQFHTTTRKQRVDPEWWEETLFPYLPGDTAADREEDEDMNRQLHDRPLPSSVSELKNHPLYVLKEHLLKFQAIYPPDAPPLGFVRGKPVYARECVKTLHSRETWVKEAKVVRLREQPYKIVKARPKYDRLSGKVITDLPLELFGEWQVEDYIPPPAVDGKVPRNAYGNVDLFKPCMLPKGTVHLQINGLNRVAKKLGIDCAPAVVGFDFHGGWSHPMIDGFVVCEEFQETLLDAWNQEQDESERRRQEKRDSRIYGNWRRLVRGLLIRERLKQRYSFGDEPGTSGEGKTKPGVKKTKKK